LPRFLGIELADDAVTAVIIEPEGKKARVLEQLSVDYATVEGGGPIGLDAALEALDELVSRITVPVDRVGFAMSHHRVSVRSVDVRMIQQRELARTAPYAVEEQLPFDFEEALIDYVVADRNDQRTRLLAFAVRKEHLSQVLACFAKHGLEPSFIDVDVFSLSAALAYVGVPAGAVRIVAGRRFANVIFERDGRICALSSTRLTNPGQQGEALAGQIRLGLVEHQLGAASQNPTFIDLTGENLSLARELSRHLGADVSGLNVADYAQSLSLGSAPLRARELGALGTALRAAGLVEGGIDFRKEEFGTGEKTRERARYGTILGMFLLALLVALGIGAWKRNAETADALHKIEQHERLIWSELFPRQAFPSSPAAYLESALAQRDAAPTGDLAAYRNTLDALRTVFSAFNEDLNLEIQSLDITQDGVELLGETTSFTKVEEIASALRQTGQLNAEILSSTSLPSQRIRFNISARYTASGQP